AVRLGPAGSHDATAREEHEREQRDRELGARSEALPREHHGDRTEDGRDRRDDVDRRCRVEIRHEHVGPESEHSAREEDERGDAWREHAGVELTEKKTQLARGAADVPTQSRPKRRHRPPLPVQTAPGRFIGTRPGDLEGTFRKLGWRARRAVTRAAVVSGPPSPEAATGPN